MHFIVYSQSYFPDVHFRSINTFSIQFVSLSLQLPNVRLNRRLLHLLSFISFVYFTMKKRSHGDRKRIYHKHALTDIFIKKEKKIDLLFIKGIYIYAYFTKESNIRYLTIINEDRQMENQPRKRRKSRMLIIVQTISVL